MSDGQQKRNLEELLARLLETTERLEERVARLEGQPSPKASQAPVAPVPPPLVLPVDPSAVPSAVVGSQSTAPFVSVPPPPAVPPLPGAGSVPFHKEPNVEPPADPLVDALGSASEAAASSAAVPLRLHPEVPEALVDFGRVPSAPAPRKESWEVRIGTYWLPRIAVFFLALAIVLAARQYFQGPWGKVLLGYGLSLGLIIAGLIKEKKYPMWARPVLAAGLAFSYFTTYAIGFVDQMRIIESLPLKLGLLAANVAGILGVAHWKRSEAIGGMALVLGYLTTGLTGTGQAARFATLGLSVVAMLFMLINRWVYSTAVAAVATYAAHLYAFKFVESSAGAAPDQIFMQHAWFLACYFIVFLAASLFGVRRDTAPRGDAVEGSWSSDALPLLVQINLAAFLGSMIHLYYDTGIFWTRVEYFLFAYAAVVFGLSFLFRSRPAVQGSHLVASSVALAFGIIASVTPHWLPLMLGVQALGMLRMSRFGFPRLWAGLSLLALAYAGMRLFLQHDVEANTSLITFAGFAALLLAYSWAWRRWVEESVQTGLSGLEYLFPVAAGLLLWQGGRVHLVDADVMPFLLSSAAGVSALAVVTRFSPFLAFTITVAVVAVPAFADHEYNDLPLWHGAIALACVTAGYAVEKLLTRHLLERYSWRFLYAWGAVLLVLALPGHLRDSVPGIGLVALAFAGGGVALGSAALVKTALVPGLIATAGLVAAPHLSIFEQVLTYVLVFGAALVVATPQWYRRSGEWRSELAEWLQFVLVLAATMAMAYRLSAESIYDISVMAGLATAVALVGAALGRLKLYLVTALMLLAAGITAMATVAEGQGRFDGKLLAFDGVLAAFLMVLIERVIAWRSGREAERKAKQGQLIRGFRTILAVVSLIFAVVMLQFHPSIQVFYFTGALVGLAFIWMVFGFWFGESSYRQAGFGALCLGILKGLVWDVLSLKEPIYRIASWAALGVIAIAASFLYNRYRGRLGRGEE